MDTQDDALPLLPPDNGDEQAKRDGIAAAAENPGRGTFSDLFDSDTTLAGLSGLADSMPSPGDPVSLPSAPSVMPDDAGSSSLASSVGPSMPTSTSDVPVMTPRAPLPSFVPGHSGSEKGGGFLASLGGMAKALLGAGPDASQGGEAPEAAPAERPSGTAASFDPSFLAGLAQAAIMPASDTGSLSGLFRSAPGEADGAEQGGQSQQSGGFEGMLEKAKLGLDVVGVFDPTGLADLTSGAISLGQGVHKLAKGEEGAGQHFIDAGISAVSAIPGGDVAKLGKLRHLQKFTPAAKAYKRQQTEDKLGGLGGVLSMLEDGAPATGGLSDFGGVGGLLSPGGSGGLGGAFGSSMGGEFDQPSIAAAGGGTFIADGPTHLTVGDAPDPELVTVTPLGRKGTTTVNGSYASFAGGGSLIAGQAETDVIAGAAGYGKQFASDAMAGDWKAVGVELVRLPGLLHDWSEELIASRGTLAEISAPQAMIAAEHEVRGIQRGIESGSATADSTAKLTDALDDLDDELQPIKDAITNAVQNGIAPLIKSIDTGVEYLKAFVESGGDLNVTRETVDTNRRVRAEQEENEESFGMGTFSDFLHEFDQRMRDEERRGPRVPRR